MHDANKSLRISASGTVSHCCRIVVLSTDTGVESSLLQSQQSTMLRRSALLLHTASLARALTTSTPLFAASAAKKLRPSKDDVDRISWGKPSKKKGVGSRGTPHRLNEAERAEYDRAKARGYVEVAGSAWRKERRDAPLLNTWRNWCDAVALPSISVQKGTDVDLVVVDLSPLRRPDVLEVAAAVRARPTPCASIEVGETEIIVDDEARPIHQLPRYELAWHRPVWKSTRADLQIASMAWARGNLIFTQAGPHASRGQGPGEGARDGLRPRTEEGVGRASSAARQGWQGPPARGLRYLIWLLYNY